MGNIIKEFYGSMPIYEARDRRIRESKNQTKLRCKSCGHKFSKNIRKMAMYMVECPKCNKHDVGYDE